jgi:hypothetical protein
LVIHAVVANTTNWRELAASFRRFRNLALLHDSPRELFLQRSVAGLAICLVAMPCRIWRQLPGP